MAKNGRICSVLELTIRRGNYPFLLPRHIFVASVPYAITSCLQVLIEVTASASSAEKVKASVQKVKDKAQAIVDEIAHEKSIATVKLEAARPALEEAEAALQTIKPAHISTVRKLAKPPHLIMRIMDAVLILFQKRLEPIQMDPDRPCVKPSWSEALKVLA